MNLLFTYTLITLIAVIIMFSVPLILSALFKKWKEKNSSFECGLSLTSAPRKPFSLRFFLLMVLFIIFDVEIALLLGIPLLVPGSSKMMSFIVIFLMVLTLGLMYEWMEGSLNWKA